jgi:small subunit ribosomal protein S15
MLNVKEKQKIIEKFRSHTSDTGSSSVQIAVLSEEIKRLSDHLKDHHKDNHSRRGLLSMVAKRKTLLDYLSDQNQKEYNTVIKKLGLKKKVKA